MFTLYHDIAHERYLRTRRHWCPHSEPYSGTDSLLTALNEGWQLFDMVFREDILLGRSRHTTVYHFGLRREMLFVRMSIVSNPYLERIIQHEALRVMLRRDTPKIAEARQIALA
ncbi:MAG: hypothetical protein ACPG7F_03125 [Aggregatilineales bacterium]